MYVYMLFAARIPFSNLQELFLHFIYTTAFIYYYKYVEVAGFCTVLFYVFVLYISLRLRFDLPIVETLYLFLLYGCALLLL